LILSQPAGNHLKFISSQSIPSLSPNPAIASHLYICCFTPINLHKHWTIKNICICWSGNRASSLYLYSTEKIGMKAIQTASILFYILEYLWNIMLKCWKKRSILCIRIKLMLTLEPAKSMRKYEI
jgi:hypothetical protein